MLDMKDALACPGMDWGWCKVCKMPGWSCPYHDTVCPLCGAILVTRTEQYGGTYIGAPEPPELLAYKNCPNCCNLRAVVIDLIDTSVSNF